MTSLIRVSKENFRRFQREIMSIEAVSFPTPWSVNQFLVELKSPVSQLWVLSGVTGVRGYICFQLYCGELHLLNVAVHPEQRGRGLGRRLLAGMIEVGKGEDVERAWLEVRPSNDAARGLYEGAGFKEILRRRRYYTDTGEDAIIMALDLKGRAPDARFPSRAMYTHAVE